MFYIGRPESISRVVDLHRRIHRVVDFIDRNLDAALTQENLAEIACICRTISIAPPYDGPFRCDLCFRAEIRDLLPQTQNFEETIIAGGHYAGVEQRGRLFDLAPYWRRFVDQRLPSFGWRARNLPIVRMCLSDRAVTPPSQRLGYLYIPVERIDA